MASPNPLWSSEILYDRCLHLKTLLSHCQIVDRSAKFCWAPRRPQSRKAAGDKVSVNVMGPPPQAPAFVPDARLTAARFANRAILALSAI
jgi:hypothetical protein